MKTNKLLKIVKPLLIIGYLIGMLFLVVFLRQQEQIGSVSKALSASMFDIYAFSVGIIINMMLPFNISVDKKRVMLLSYILADVLLIVAVCLRCLTAQEIWTDILYVLAGAMFYQAVKLTIELKKGSSITSEEKN